MTLKEFDKAKKELDLSEKLMKDIFIEEDDHVRFLLHEQRAYIADMRNELTLEQAAQA